MKVAKKLQFIFSEREARDILLALYAVKSPIICRDPNNADNMIVVRHEKPGLHFLAARDREKTKLAIQQERQEELVKQIEKALGING